MKTIIAPTDFSPVSINAVNYAADMSCMIGARLVLFHVYSVPTPVSEMPLSVYNAEQLESEARQQINALKEKLLSGREKKIMVQCEVKQGNVVAELIEYCFKIQPHAVVMGAESASGFERFLVGGKTVSALKSLQWPLLIVPPLVKFNNIRKIGLACDLREVAGSVRVQEIKELVNEFGAELHVLHVSEETLDRFSAKTIEGSGLLQEMLAGMNPRYHFISDPVIERGIIDFAEKNQLDMLIIIPKKHSLVGKIFHHSHSKQIVLHAHIPVMTVHE